MRTSLKLEKYETNPNKNSNNNMNKIIRRLSLNNTKWNTNKISVKSFNTAKAIKNWRRDGFDLAKRESKGKIKDITK